MIHQRITDIIKETEALRGELATMTIGTSDTSAIADSMIVSLDDLLRMARELSETAKPIFCGVCGKQYTENVFNRAFLIPDCDCHDPITCASCLGAGVVAETGWYCGCAAGLALYNNDVANTERRAYTD